jgi:hypothetical protein
MAKTLSYYANTPGTGNRFPSGNPAGAAPYSTPLPEGIERAHLFIQNKGNTDIELTLAASGATIKLFAGASISIDNYNGGFNINNFANASIQEAFLS